MPACKLRNVDDIPVCVTNPETGEAYSLMPGAVASAKTEWPDVQEKLRDGRVRIESVGQ